MTNLVLERFLVWNVLVVSPVHPCDNILHQTGNALPEIRSISRLNNRSVSMKIVLNCSKVVVAFSFSFVCFVWFKWDSICIMYLLLIRWLYLQRIFVWCIRRPRQYTAFWVSLPDLPCSLCRFSVDGITSFIYYTLTCGSNFQSEMVEVCGERTKLFYPIFPWVDEDYWIVDHLT